MTRFILFYILYSASFIVFSQAAVSDYGEPCTFSDECIDHRMDCQPDDKNITRCVCAKFHAWINETLGCVQISTTKYILSKLVDYNERENWSAFDDVVIWWAWIAALFVTAVLLICVFLVIIFCIYTKNSDRKLKEYVRVLTASSGTGFSGNNMRSSMKTKPEKKLVEQA